MGGDDQKEEGGGAEDEEEGEEGERKEWIQKGERTERGNEERIEGGEEAIFASD